MNPVDEAVQKLSAQHRPRVVNERQTYGVKPRLEHSVVCPGVRFDSIVRRQLFFAANDGELGSQTGASQGRGGVGGMQMWTTDGTKAGTPRG